MDIRTLKNLMRVAQSGSLTAAADSCCLTVQALAAQLNKVEAQFGFRLFKRSNKGLTLTDEGLALAPYIEQVVSAGRELEDQVEKLGTPRRQLLRVALNSTLSFDVNRSIVARMIEAFEGYEMEFSYAESVENLSKLNHEGYDMAVVIGARPPAMLSVQLPSVQVKVVGVHCGIPGTRLPALLDKLQVRPSSSCPYFDSFQRLLASAGLHDTKPVNVVLSGSETLTLSLVRQLDGIGVVSRSAAEQSGLVIVPDFEDELEVQLVVNNANLPVHAINHVVHMPLQQSADGQVGRHAKRHAEKQVPAQVCA